MPDMEGPRMPAWVDSPSFVTISSIIHFHVSCYKGYRLEIRFKPWRTVMRDPSVTPINRIQYLKRSALFCPKSPYWRSIPTVNLGYIPSADMPWTLRLGDILRWKGDFFSGAATCKFDPTIALPQYTATFPIRLYPTPQEEIMKIRPIISLAVEIGVMLTLYYSRVLLVSSIWWSDHRTLSEVSIS